MPFSYKADSSLMLWQKLAREQGCKMLRLETPLLTRGFLPSNALKLREN